MLRWILLIALVLTFAPSAASQSAREDKLNKQQAKALNDYAEDALKAGFPRVAKRMWLMLLSEYDSEHADARKALGYQKVGESWALDPRFVYPKDDVPDPKKADQLKDKWVKVSKSLADAHLSIAEEYSKAGRTDMALRHYEKVIYYEPDDEKEKAALYHNHVAGLTATHLEQEL
jgi:Tfp pilus assembly protein PilF